MNKNELIAAVAQATGISRTDAGRVVDSVFEAIGQALRVGRDVRLVGFGTFTVAAREAREARNPRTGETIRVQASRQPRFRAGKSLRAALDGDPTTDP